MSRSITCPLTEVRSMNRFRSGLVPLFAVLAIVGCSSEPTGDLRDTPPTLQASPSQLFLEVGANAARGTSRQPEEAGPHAGSRTLKTAST